MPLTDDLMMVLPHLDRTGLSLVVAWCDADDDHLRDAADELAGHLIDLRENPRWDFSEMLESLPPDTVENLKRILERGRGTGRPHNPADHAYDSLATAMDATAADIVESLMLAPDLPSNELECRVDLRASAQSRLDGMQQRCPSNG